VARARWPVAIPNPNPNPQSPIPDPRGPRPDPRFDPRGPPPEARYNDVVTRVLGLLFSAAYAALIVWLYASQPQTSAEALGGLAATVGVYRVDARAFDEGLAFFRRDQFAEARMAFARADPARRDPRTQFYIAYSFYREGWGRLYNDDELFQKGVEAVDRAIAIAPGGRVVLDDADLGMRSSDELKAELERGLRRDASDINPLRVLDRRK
jgi:tetratricopeptide (TPR) repeat protein